MAYIPSGGAFRVNTQILGNQERPDIGVLSTGGFVVVWEDHNEPLTNANIKAQIYNASGAKVGGEFLVNTQAIGNQVFPSVIGLSGGRFIVTWSDGSGRSDFDFASVEAQIFDSSSNKIGSEFVVNTQTTKSQAGSQITPLTGGGFVITWADEVGLTIKAQIYDANGGRVGGELTVGTEGFDFAKPTVVAGLANGGFVIAFESGNGVFGSGSTNSIRAQLFDAAGARIGGEVLVNTTTASIQGTPDVAVLSDGRFVICWHYELGEIRAQLFDPTGSKIGAEFQINTKTQFDQSQPSIAALPDGGFIVSWADQKPQSLAAEIKAQIFDASLTKVGTEFLVGPTGSFNQVHPSAAVLPDGDLLIAWTDVFNEAFGDLNGTAVLAQLYQFVYEPKVHWMASVAIGPHPAGWLPSGIGDFNADGTSDLAWYNASTGNVDIWKLANGKWAGSADVGAHPPGYQPVGFGDYNRDGTSDVLWFNPATRSVDLWKLVNGQWTGSADIGTHPAGWQPIGAGDFNGDGTGDVAWFNASNGNVDIWKIANGQWAGSVDVGPHPAGYQPVLTGDFNGDGTSDIAWYNPSTGDVDIWKIANGQWAGSVSVGAHPTGWQPLGAGDFNGDSTSDIAWYNPATNNIDVWLINNGQWAGSFNVGTHPAGAVAIGIGDFDGNGVSDIMWRDVNTGRIDNWMLAYS